MGQLSINHTLELAYSVVWLVFFDRLQFSVRFFPVSRLAYIEFSISVDRPATDLLPSSKRSSVSRPVGGEVAD